MKKGGIPLSFGRGARGEVLKELRNIYPIDLMKTERLTFKNADGHELAARLELPADQHPHTFAVFAHCFTCGKNIRAAQTIARALTPFGVAVLRFDFTGLGQSEGDFSETTFSSNVDDLVAAADFLRQNYQAPRLLIGHSLGGAAVIMAAGAVPEIEAIATVAAPADPEHVTHLLVEDESEDQTFRIAGRPFRVKPQFVEDLREQNMKGCLSRLKKESLLFLHSPQDETVGIQNAAALYENAFHPKSFISLDGADHLLTNKADARYVGEVIASWVKRYIAAPEPEKLKSDHQVVAQIGEDTYTTEIQVGHYGLLADEPEDVGGNGYGPTPYELVASGLGACTAITLRMYANHKGWPLEAVRVHINHDKDYDEDCQDTENKSSKIDHFRRSIELIGEELSSKQRERLIKIANKCPVHKTLEGEAVVKTSVKESS